MTADIPDPSGSRASGADRLLDRIAAGGGGLTAAERRVADVLADRSSNLAFDTVAEIAERAEVGVASVMRCVAKLGYSGFAEVQAAARQEMMTAVPAAARIRRDGRPSPMPGMVDAENLRRAYENLDPAVIAETAERLAVATTIIVIAGDAWRGIALQIASDLGSLRPGVHLVDGNPVAVARMSTLVDAETVTIALDVARYDAWVVETIALHREHRAWILALTDHPLSPLAAVADRTVLIETESTGPFESHVTTLSIANEIVAELADRIRPAATRRLDDYELAWSRSGALVDR